MPRLDLLLFGYRKIKISEKDINRALNLLLQNNIRIRIDIDTFIVSESVFKKIEKLFADKIEYSASELLGFRGFLFKNRHRYGIFIALFIGCILSLFSSSVVWDIRVEGNELSSDEEIIQELSSVGFKVGSLWKVSDKNKIEASMLDISDSVSWININRRGCVAYVKVIDKISYPQEEEKVCFANLVAERDCIIEEITVVEGYALVKPGETVKKGQILISGVIPSEAGGGFCYAKGSVIGRYSDEISVNLSRSGMEKVLKDKKLRSYSLVFFGKRLNIFKSYGNLSEECGIIEDKRSISFFGIKKLPFEIRKEYSFEYEFQEIIYDDLQITKAAAEQLQSELKKQLTSADLLRIKTSGDFTSDGYFLKSEYVCKRDIAKTEEFFVNPD